MLLLSIITEHRCAKSELSLEGDAGKAWIYELIWDKKNGVCQAGELL